MRHSAAKIFFLSLVVLFSDTALADRLDRMISPLTNPTTFEDPRIRTEIQPIFMYHEIQDDFATEGGNFQYYGVQGRLAYTRDLAFTMTKFGIVDFSPSENMESSTGLTNLALGAKYAVMQDHAVGQIWSVGFRYELPTGQTDVQQGEGKGYLNPYTSAAMAITDDINLVGNTGLRIRTDNKDSSFWDTNLHADMNLGSFYPFVELNMVQSIGNGKRLVSSSEGADMFDFGATDASGRMLITGGAGARYRFCDALTAGVGYQFPMTNSGAQFFDWRITADVIISF